MPESDPLHLRFDQFELDEGQARLTCDAKPLALPPKAFSVLCALARRPSQLVTKTELLDAVWGHRYVSDSVLKTTISELRSVLGDEAKQPRYIETASRRGYRFIGAAAASTPVTMAPRIDDTAASASPQSLLIGRQPALERLRAAWRLASDGRRQIFWITGEAGIGKTTLIDRFVAAAGATRCAYGQCVEQYGAGEPYLPVLEALASLTRGDPALTPLLRSVAPTWLLQLPWLCREDERDSLRGRLAGVGPERMLRELGELLDRYTQAQPLLLVTEDLHWADHATLQLIDHIARRRGPARLLWLASFRLAEVISEDHPLKALRHELRLHKLCEEAMLDPFSEREVADYIDGRIAGGAVSDDFVRALHAHTDGLPLFVVNLLDEMLARGSLGADGSSAAAGLSVAQMQVPESLAGVIDQQMARLSPDERDVLEAASVCGVEFRAGTVADVLGRDAGWVGARCDDLARRQRWLGAAGVDVRDDGSVDASYSFRHALYRHVLYQRIGASTRAQRHRKVAQSLQRRRGAGANVAAAELASHFEASHDAAAAIGHYAEAAQSALTHFAPREALALAVHALTLLERCAAGRARDAMELALVIPKGIATSQLQGVGSLAAKDAFERALALVDALPPDPAHGLVLHELGLVLTIRGDYAKARELGERLVALAERHRDRALFVCACSIIGQIDALRGRHHEACERLEQGIAACDELGDDFMRRAFIVDPSVTMRGCLALPLVHLGLIDRALASADAADMRARRSGQPMSRLVVAWCRALVELRLQRPERVAELAAEMRALVDEQGLAQGEGGSRWFLGWARAQQGEPLAGYQMIREGYDHNARLGMFVEAAQILGFAVDALVLAGDWERAQATAEEALQLAYRLDERVYLTQLLVLRGRIALARGSLDEARESMRDALREAREQRGVWLELVALVALARLDGATGADFDALADARSRLPEGSDTALARQAEAVLAHRV